MKLLLIANTIMLMWLLIIKIMEKMQIKKRMEQYDEQDQRNVKRLWVRQQRMSEIHRIYMNMQPKTERRTQQERLDFMWLEKKPVEKERVDQSTRYSVWQEVVMKWSWNVLTITKVKKQWMQSDDLYYPQENADRCSFTLSDIDYNATLLHNW